MKIILCLLIVAAFIFAESSADCPSGVALTCLNPTNGVTVDHGASGPPGKRGATGSPGPKGDQGNPGPQGQCSEQCINTLTDAQQRITELEARLGRLDILGKKNCDDVAERGITENGVHNISINGRSVAVYCDFQTDGGNWLIFQRRESGLVDFYRNWRAYQNGFGEKTGEFWIGLDNLHALTSGNPYQLRIDMEDFDGNQRYATYSSFSVEDSSDNYLLRLGAYSGNATDPLTYHNGIPFSTYDQDNDAHGANCAENFRGAWWYNHCHNVNLNGMYLARGEDSSDCTGLRWRGFPGLPACNSLKRTEMKIRLN